MILGDKKLQHVVGNPPGFKKELLGFEMKKKKFLYFLCEGSAKSKYACPVLCTFILTETASNMDLITFSKLPGLDRLLSCL